MRAVVYVNWRVIAALSPLYIPLIPSIRPMSANILTELMCGRFSTTPPAFHRPCDALSSCIRVFTTSIGWTNIHPDAPLEAAIANFVHAGGSGMLQAPPPRESVSTRNARAEPLHQNNSLFVSNIKIVSWHTPKTGAP